MRVLQFYLRGTLAAPTTMDTFDGYEFLLEVSRGTCKTAVSEEFKREAFKLVGQPGAGQGSDSPRHSHQRQFAGTLVQAANVDAEVAVGAKTYRPKSANACGACWRRSGGARHLKKRSATSQTTARKYLFFLSIKPIHLHERCRLLSVSSSGKLG